MPWDTVLSILFSALLLLAANSIGIGWKELAISSNNAVAGGYKKEKKKSFIAGSTAEKPEIYFYLHRRPQADVLLKYCEVRAALQPPLPSIAVGSC